jgi:hypothetical protein
MPRRIWLILLSGSILFVNVSTARATGRAVTPASDPGFEIRVRLTLQGPSQPSARVLEDACRLANGIYGAIGVSLAWMDGREIAAGTPPGQIVAAVLSRSRTDRFLRESGLPDTVLGVAPRNTGRVYVFWDRIVHRAERNQVLPQVVLGRVLAHEIGHHLLPSRSHSVEGLMQPSLNFTVRTPPTFTDDEARAIRLLLSHALP